MPISVRAPAVSRSPARTSSKTDSGSPASSDTRSRSDAVKSSSPAMAAAVTLATSAAQPARSASRSITSSRMRVESTSMTISRSARRCRPPRWTATSMPCSTAARARSSRSSPGSPPDTSSSMQVTGCRASLPMRSMLAPLAAIRPAMAVMAAGASGLPSRVTCSCPLRGAGSPEPIVNSASRPRSPASAWTASKMAFRSGCSSQPSSTPSTSRPRITTCSTSSTDSGCPASAPNSLEVTPGRSRPVSVMSSEVRGVFIAGARLPEPPLDQGSSR